MGVHELWKLLGPCGRLISLETLSSKRLAIDASIWLIQFVKAMRDDEGNTIANAPLVGMFRRICRLMYYNIRPVFVFDGPAPSLKRRTLKQRRKAREKSRSSVQRQAERLVLSQLRLKKITAANAKLKRVVALQRNGGGGDDGDGAAVEVVVQQPQSQLDRVDTISESSSSSSGGHDDDDYDGIYIEPGTMVDPETLAALPLSVQYEIVRRQTNGENPDALRLDMNEANRDPSDFSSAQLTKFLKTTAVKRKFSEIRMKLGGLKSEEGRNVLNIASETDKGMLFYDRTKSNDNDDDSDGGGRGGFIVPGTIIDTANEKNKRVKMAPKAAPVPIDDDIVTDSDIDSVQQRSSSSVAVEQWSCTVCTLLNDATVGVCIVCNSPRVYVAPTNAAIQVDDDDDTSVATVEMQQTPQQQQESEAPQRLHPSNSKAELPVWDDEEDDNDDDDMRKDADEEPPSRHMQWPCTKCTTWNTMAVLRCSMCDDSRAMSTSDLPMFERAARLAYEQKLQEINATRVSPQRRRPPSPYTPSPRQQQQSEEQVSFELHRTPVIPRIIEEIEDPTDDDDELPQQPPPSPVEGISGNATIGVGGFSDDDDDNDDVETEGRHQGEKSPMSPSPSSSAAQQQQQQNQIGERSPPPPPAVAAAAAVNVSGGSASAGGGYFAPGYDYGRVEAGLAPVGDPVAGEEALDAMAAAAMNDIAQQRTLQQQLQRDAAHVTDEMVNDAKRLLELCGVPYIVSPAEAEAQCAELECLGLVDGIVTEDSDTLLFGGKNIYRSLFSQKKDAQWFSIDAITEEFGLDREKLVCLALLLGSDYAEGIRGIGKVTAMEIIQMFPGKEGLVDFRNWVYSDQRIAEPTAAMRTSKDADDMRTVYMYENRRRKHTWDVSANFPDMAAISGYWRPQVDHSTEPFEWGHVQRAELTAFCQTKFAWTAEMTERVIGGMTTRTNDEQRRIHQYFPNDGQFADIESVRVQKVVASLTGKPLKPVKKRSPTKKRQRSSNDDDLSAVDLELSGNVFINRAPIFALWVSIVTAKLWSLPDWKDASAFGFAVMQHIARKSDPRRRANDNHTTVSDATRSILGVVVPVVLQNDAYLPVSAKGIVIPKERALRYIRKQFADDLHRVRIVMELLAGRLHATATTPDEFQTMARDTYKQFRPQAPRGHKGYFSLDKVRSLAKQYGPPPGGGGGGGGGVE